MAQVFISYAREDRDLALALANMLQDAGVSVWWDREIEFGEPFADVIERELGEASCVVVLWSKHSVTSNWVRAEAGDAAERSKLLPALLDDSRPPLQFRGLHTADLSSWRGRAGDPSVEDFVAHLRAQVGAGPKPAPRPAPEHRGPSTRTLALVIGSICLALVGGGLALFFGLSDPGSDAAEAEARSPAAAKTGSSAPAQSSETGGEETGPPAGETGAGETGAGESGGTTDTGEASEGLDPTSDTDTDMDTDTDTGDPEPVKAKPAVKRPRVPVELTASDYFYVEVRIGRGGRAIPLEPKAKIKLPAGRHTLYMRESASAKWRRVKQIELEAGKRYRVDLLRPLGAKVSEQ